VEPAIPNQEINLDVDGTDTESGKTGIGRKGKRKRSSGHRYIRHSGKEGLRKRKKS